MGDSVSDLTDVRVGEGGILTTPDGVGLGAVLILRHAGGDGLLLVRKAYRPEYEWSDHWALPGGMLRDCDLPEDHSQIDFHVLAAAALRRRLRAEAGIELAPGAKIEPAPPCPAPITRYTVHGAQRHVLVSAFALRGSVDVAPSASDASIAEVGWFGGDAICERWGQIAPANRIILAHALWAELSEAERHQMEPGLRGALSQLAQWSGDRGLSPAPFIT